MTNSKEQLREITKLRVGELTTAELRDLMHILAGEGWTIHLLPQDGTALRGQTTIPSELTLCICRPSSASLAS